MIGVIADGSDYAAVEEFFELFKTPWEQYRPGRQYDVLLCDGEPLVSVAGARLILVYAGRPLPLDGESGIETTAGVEGRMLSYDGAALPVYGEAVAFPPTGGILVDQFSGESLMCARPYGGGTLVRIGYSLFAEIRTLLTKGQPPVNASIPALERHIAVLRDRIVESGVPLVEIPPVPDGYSFIASLTHDVDHPLFRRHLFDHTMFGFLYRATAGSLLRFLRGRLNLAGLLRNWAAALKTPLAHLGVVRDLWADFERYAALEQDHRSSFFVIPFRDRPGRNAPVGSAPGARGAAYGAADIAPQLRRLQAHGCEIGLHGIDAWTDPANGCEEFAEIGRVTGGFSLGVRMHWLYFDENSASVLEAAGADYDSTVGYNETVGYRAGTTQVFKPFNVARLLELPLHIMDTSLFYPAHLNLSESEAAERVQRIVDNAVQYGGCVTVNWHDRSLAPERLWDGFYVRLLAMLQGSGAWFATAGQAVHWFRRRRSVVFGAGAADAGMPVFRILPEEDGEDLPGLQLRIYNSGERVRTVPLTFLPGVALARSIAN